MKDLVKIKSEQKESDKEIEIKMMYFDSKDPSWFTASAESWKEFISEKRIEFEIIHKEDNFVRVFVDDSNEFVLAREINGEDD